MNSGMQERDLQHCTNTMYRALTAYRLMDKPIKRLNKFIKPENFDDYIEFADYDDDLVQLERSREKVASALSDPILWDHFVPWDIYREAHGRDQEDLSIQTRIQIYCFVYGGSALDALDLMCSDVPEEWRGEARMRVGNAAGY